MKLIKTEQQQIKKVSYNVEHNGVEYTFTDLFEGSEIIDSYLRDKYGNNVEEPGLFEEVSNFLDQDI